MDRNDLEPFMVLIMNHFADRLPNQAVIKGGMALRLVDCPRFTNDLDYVFVPFESKKNVQGIVEKTLRELPGVSVTSSLNSQCLRWIVSYNGRKLQVEIAIARECPSIEMSTATIARPYGQQGRIARVMKFEHAFSHKLAAWNERGLMRDLYDIFFLAERVGVTPDRVVLNKRLASIEMQRKAKRIMTVKEFCEKLNAFVETVTQKEIEDGLRDYLSTVEMAGLLFKFRVAVKKTTEFLNKN